MASARDMARGRKPDGWADDAACAAACSTGSAVDIQGSAAALNAESSCEATNALSNSSSSGDGAGRGGLLSGEPTLAAAAGPEDCLRNAATVLLMRRTF